MKFSIKDFFSKCDQIGKKVRLWSYILKKPLMENFIFCVVQGSQRQFRRNSDVNQYSKQVW